MIFTPDLRGGQVWCVRQFRDLQNLWQAVLKLFWRLAVAQHFTEEILCLFFPPLTCHQSLSFPELDEKIDTTLMSWSSSQETISLAEHKERKLAC